MTGDEIEQGEDPGIAPRAALTKSANADRDNAAEGLIVGSSVAVPGRTTTGETA